ncbi:nuclear transport factor 2 family protein [Stenotrophomonas sp. Marseille-Q4652]|uniref:nuclear transport factor 2 family protein n=1 Tax=Stenotrophomonas sp. Marseille-Q4652 TaxID=2866595 RepID=UPI001CE483E3|nr:nuclear transport factor 2 family protein [Stenotrophomonas sp. Marseille-Q4652]
MQAGTRTPHERWRRSATVLQVDGAIATVRVERPWFIDHPQLGRLDGCWVIVNAPWRSRRKPQAGGSTRNEYATA